MNTTTTRRFVFFAILWLAVPFQAAAQKSFTTADGGEAVQPTCARATRKETRAW